MSFLPVKFYFHINQFHFLDTNGVSDNSDTNYLESAQTHLTG